MLCSCQKTMTPLSFFSIEFIIPFMISELCPLIHWKTTIFLFSYSNFVFPWPIVFKFLQNIFFTTICKSSLILAIMSCMVQRVIPLDWLKKCKFFFISCSNSKFGFLNQLKDIKIFSAAPGIHCDLNWAGNYRHILLFLSIKIMTCKTYKTYKLFIIWFQLINVSVA